VSERRAVSDSERPARLLDDEADREELRDRYYGLLQELRVVLPGVQVLLAFLLTVPFAQRFEVLDTTDRAVFGAGLVCAMFSVIAFITPIALHRVGPRTERSERLALSIFAVRAGLGFLALSILLSFAVVSNLLFDPVPATALVVLTAIAMLSFWVLLPLLLRADRRH
jgi:hypothetical protein